MTAPPTASLEIEFARYVGDVAESFNFSKSIGQIYGLLYISPAPVSLSDICARLSMSKGNASINVRLLESWGAVRPVSQMGSRKDFYEADRDVKKLAINRLREGMTKRLDSAEGLLAGLIERAGGSAAKFDAARLHDLRGTLAKARKALGFATKWLA